MRALTAAALLITSAPALAFAGSAVASGADDAERQRRVCTRIERYGGSRISHQRVCLTEAQWRERLGPDWRQQLTGRNPEDDFEGLDSRTRMWRPDENGARPTGPGPR